MNEEQAVARFIVATLSGAAGVTAQVGARIYEALGPESAPFPFVVFSFHAGSDTQALGSDVRTLTRSLFLIRAICDGPSFAPADAVMAAVDAALMGAHGPVTVGSDTYEVLTAYREQPFRRVEYSDSKRYNHVGGLYRFPCYRSG